MREFLEIDAVQREREKNRGDEETEKEGQKASSIQKVDKETKRTGDKEIIRLVSLSPCHTSGFRKYQNPMIARIGDVQISLRVEREPGGHIE